MIVDPDYKKIHFLRDKIRKLRIGQSFNYPCSSFPVRCYTLASENKMRVSLSPIYGKHDGTKYIHRNGYEVIVPTIIGYEVKRFE